MLPSPSCSFSIPSVNDNIELKCRLYFPRQPDHVGTVSGFATIAHPYAPLGGCYDDPTVHAIGSTLLRQNLILCTFNFRGATGSQGRTSWTGKSELADYVSIYVFMLHLINHTNVVDRASLTDGKPLLILSGYSYGSMIASHLPDIATIQSFSDGSQIDAAGQEIKLTAQKIGEVLTGTLQTQTTHTTKLPRAENDKTPSTSKREVMMGGHDSETHPGKEQSRLSVDAERIRQGMERIKHKVTHHGDLTKQAQDPEQTLKSDTHRAFTTEPLIAYLLVSPLLQPVAGFTTTFSRLVFESKHIACTSKTQKSIDENLVKNPTLVVYGDKDIFTSARKLRKWTNDLQTKSGIRFTSEEITGAGHFWHQEGPRAELRASVREWVSSLRNLSIDHKSIT